MKMYEGWKYWAMDVEYDNLDVESLQPQYLGDGIWEVFDCDAPDYGMNIMEVYKANLIFARSYSSPHLSARRAGLGRIIKNRLGRNGETVHDSKISEYVASVSLAVAREEAEQEVKRKTTPIKYSNESSRILNTCILHNLKPRQNVPICEYTMDAWLREVCTIRLNMGRQWGHTSSAIEVLPDIFSNVLYVAPNYKLCDMLKNRDKNEYKSKGSSTFTTIFHAFERCSVTLCRFDCICIDNASYAKLDLNHIYDCISRAHRSTLSPKLERFTLLFLG